MLDNIEYILPDEIEKKSFAIITEQLKEYQFTKEQELIIKRVIHTTADFEYAHTLKISSHAVKSAIGALRKGCSIVTDTTMAMAGINKRALSAFGGQCHCLIRDETVIKEAKKQGVTRSCVAVDVGAKDSKNEIFVVGNAPTALLRLYELVIENKIKPALVVGVPVGFVNVVESKELFMKTDCPFIISEGRKGGSNVAAAIINAILYMANGDRRE